ncbi:hypothetical protein ES332_D03G156800v1 [Gossypium tomentosum]|uniref:Uncharacterized protein n=1 Tax=Gossypium tomentosum TaxID=34277 RepID=A0A5D2LNG0_GOSTO|nr:hypothetical protein ES332_D03G156800v1 [Gossypium tomentosum]
MLSKVLNLSLSGYKKRHWTRCDYRIYEYLGQKKKQLKVKTFYSFSLWGLRNCYVEPAWVLFPSWFVIIMEGGVRWLVFSCFTLRSSTVKKTPAALNNCSKKQLVPAWLFVHVLLVSATH